MVIFFFLIELRKSIPFTHRFIGTDFTNEPVYIFCLNYRMRFGIFF